MKRSIRNIDFLLHIIVLLLSLYLIVTISLDTFKGINFYSPRFLTLQSYICVAFMVIFFIETAIAEKRWRFFRNNIVFLLFSIPYLYIFHALHLSFNPKVGYLIQYIPLVRGGYALAIVVGWFSYNRATSLFVTYLVTLLATVYFGSLIFYLFEHTLNKGVGSYMDALWWALMDMTTVGSSISPVTPIGKIMAVVLAALGMMMLPLFTVYVSSLITQKRQSAQPGISNMSPYLQLNSQKTDPSPDSTATATPAVPAKDSATENSENRQ